MVEKSESRLVYAASESCANLLYESGFQAPDPFLWFEHEGKSFMVVSALEYGRALEQAKPDIEVVCYDNLKERFALKHQPEYGALAQVLAISRALGQKHWTVPYDFPLGLAQALTRRRIRLGVKQDFSPGRLCKNEQEQQAIAKALALAESGLARAEEVLRQSQIGSDELLYWQGEQLSAEQLRAEIDSTILHNGGLASGTICAPGVQGADPHQRGSGPIAANVPIVLDIFPRHTASGYYGDLTRTLVKGKAADSVWQAFEAVQEAQKKALQSLKAGISGKEVHELVEYCFAKHGFETLTEGVDKPRGFFHSTGHGLGLEVHELPSLSRRQVEPLQSGQVVTVEPGLYYPEWGGVRLEDVAVVCEKGHRNLTKAAIYLEI
ncbi:MAG: aminopeptidase P family protein [Oligosphaeraceae bacterium]|nr:aminopeptidase P family protein [Oligosphaeraceae bacterium]